MNVVIADDSQAVVDRVCDLLRDIEGIELAGHSSAVHETSRLIDELHPDILILDLQLSDGSGIPVLAGIKRSHPRSSVIILTNNVAPPIREKCLLAGADFFLDKSNEFDCLPQIVRTLVQIARTAHQPKPASPQFPPAGSGGQFGDGEDNLPLLR